MGHLTAVHLQQTVALAELLRQEEYAAAVDRVELKMLMDFTFVSSVVEGQATRGAVELQEALCLVRSYASAHQPSCFAGDATRKLLEGDRGR